MRSILTLGPTLLLAVSLAAAQTPDAANLEATVVDSGNHKVIFENDQVTVVRYTIPPHTKTVLHSHPAMVSILLTDATAKVSTPDGKVTDVHGTAGSVVWRGPTVHTYENVSDTAIVGVLVEPKKPASTLPPGAPDVMAAQLHTKLEFENDQVRVIRYRVEPGEKSAMHGHPDNVQVALTDFSARSTMPDGKTMELQRKAGDVSWRPAGQHIVENIGDKAYEGIIVEMKGRPPASN